jgi:phage terminase large subunit-like protein
MSALSNLSAQELLASLSVEEREEILGALSEQQLRNLLYDWEYFGRPNQLIPLGDWTYWVVLAGRGFGKTRTGAETVRRWVTQGYKLIHLVGSTAGDARDVMIQGESGLLACFPPHERPLYEPSKRLITFANGAIARVFSADEPERLRGPQCAAFWADEIAAWRFLDDAWDNLQFGFRLGDDPRGIITTTPKPLKLLKELIVDPATVVTRASSYENRANLAPAFFQSIIRKYEGTRLGRQELNAEILEDVPGALWTMGLIDQARIRRDQVNLGLFVRVVVAIDPAVSSNADSDDTGIVVAGLLDNGEVVVLEDDTVKASPAEWARIVIEAFQRHNADRIIGEVNNGGDLVEANLRALAPNIPYRGVRASRGKVIRAEPVAALYEQGRVHHAGYFAALEEQLCSWSPLSNMKSPDRLDALVWAITDLVVDPEETMAYTQIMPPVQISSY